MLHFVKCHGWVDGRQGDGSAGRDTGCVDGEGWGGWRGTGRDGHINVQVLYINIPEQ